MLKSIYYQFTVARNEVILLCSTDKLLTTPYSCFVCDVNVTVTAKPGKFLCSVNTAKTRKSKKGKELSTDWGNFLGRIVFSEYCLLHFILCKLAKSYVFVRTYSLSTRNIIIGYRTFVACLNTLSICPSSKKKKNKRKTLLFPMIAKQKKIITFIHPTIWKRVATTIYAQDSV